MSQIEVPALRGSKSVVVLIDEPVLGQELEPGVKTPSGQLIMRVLLPAYGDRRFSWNPLSLEEIREAEQFFNQCIAEGLVPYRVGAGGKSAEMMAEFEPGAGEAVFREIAERGESVVMNPQPMIAGGGGDEMNWSTYTDNATSIEISVDSLRDVINSTRMTEPVSIREISTSYDLAQQRYQVITTSSAGTTHTWEIDPLTFSRQHWHRYIRLPVTSVWHDCSVDYPPPTPREILKQQLKQRMGPAIHVGRRHLQPGDEREERARETLRTLIGEARWRGFVKNGFISVHAKDGRVYQIFPGTEDNNITRVYSRGVMVKRLCCYLRGEFPPTDHLIARFLMILNNPAEFSKKCISHSTKAFGKTMILVPDKENLVEKFKRLKRIA